MCNHFYYDEYLTTEVAKDDDPFVEFYEGGTSILNRQDFWDWVEGKDLR